MSDWGEESSMAKETRIHQVMISFVENHTYLGKKCFFFEQVPTTK